MPRNHLQHGVLRVGRFWVWVVFSTFVLLDLGCSSQPSTASGGPPIDVLYKEFDAELSNFSASLATGEVVAGSEDVFSGVGELRSRLNNLRDHSASRADLQEDLKGMDETLQNVESALQDAQKLAEIRAGVEKLGEQAAKMKSKI